MTLFVPGKKTLFRYMQYNVLQVHHNYYYAVVLFLCLFLFFCFFLFFFAGSLIAFGWLTRREEFIKKIKLNLKKRTRMTPSIDIRLACVLAPLGSPIPVLSPPNLAECVRPKGQQPRLGSHCRRDLIQIIRKDRLPSLTYIFYPSVQNEKIGGKYDSLESYGTKYYPSVPPPEINVNQIDKATQATPLIFAAMKADTKKNAAVVHILLKQGAQLDLRDKHGMTALDHACRHGRIKLAKTIVRDSQLISRGVFVDGDNRGRTPLFHVSGSLRLRNANNL